MSEEQNSPSDRWKEKKLKKKEKRIEKNIEIKNAKRKLEEEKLSSMTEEEIKIYREHKFKIHGEWIEEQKKKKEQTLSRLEEVNSKSLKEQVSVCIDCGFEDKMDYRCLKSIAQQILFCYGRNLSEPIPLHLGLCEISPESKILYNLRKQTGFDNWKIRVSNKNCVEMFKDAKKVVYLSADSKNILETLEVGTCYVIGGIVDRNKYKGLCEGKAKELGIETARFPLLENVKLTSSCVLATNHCFDILHEIKNEKSWKEALESVIPLRKRDIEHVTCVDDDDDEIKVSKSDEIIESE